MACSTPLPGAPRTPKRRRSHHVDRDREDGWLPRPRPVQKHHNPYSPIREAVKDLRRGQIHHFKRDGSPASRSQTQSQPRATKRVRHNGHGHVKRATPIGAAPDRASSANSISQEHCSSTCAQLVYPDRSQLPSAHSSSSPPLPPSSITSNSDAPATATSNINKPAVTTQQPSTSSPASTTTTTTMSYAAIAATAYTSTTCPRVVLDELSQPAAASIAPATLEADGENKAPSTAAAAPPKPIGRARSNTFYGRAQHIIVARQRSPPSSPTPPAAPPAPRLRSAAELAPEASSSRTANLRLALPSASSLTRTAVASMLERISAPPGLGMRAAASGSGLGLTLDALPIMITTTTTETECSEPAPAPRRSAASPLLPAAPVPVGPSPDAAARDSRARLVAGLLLNRVRANAPPRCRRRPVISEVPRQYVSSCLRMEVVV